MGAVPPRPPAASHRSVRLSVLALLVLAVWLSTTSTQRRGAGEQRRRAAELGEQQVAAAGAASRLESSSAAGVGARSGARPLYGLPQPELEAAVVAGSERHGPVTKAGALPQEFWTDARRPWRERVFKDMLKRGAPAGRCRMPATCPHGSLPQLFLGCSAAWYSHGVRCRTLAPLLCSPCPAVQRSFAPLARPMCACRHGAAAQ